MKNSEIKIEQLIDKLHHNNDTSAKAKEQQLNTWKRLNSIEINISAFENSILKKAPRYRFFEPICAIQMFDNSFNVLYVSYIHSKGFFVVCYSESEMELYFTELRKIKLLYLLNIVK